MGEPSRVRVTGPLEPFAAGFIAELQEAGYRPERPRCRFGCSHI